MTLATACTPRVVITGNGSLGPYSLVDSSSVAIRFVSTSHVKLTRYAASTDDNNDGTVLVLNVDYTIGGSQDARTFTLIGSQAVLTSSQRIVAERVQSYTQDLDLTTGGAFNASTVESRFDKIAEFQQELKARLDRTVPLQFSDATANVGFPSPPTSATQFLARNTAGEFAYATAADLGVDVTLGNGWETILGLPAAGILDNIAGIRFVATYAALTALTTATGLSDNSIYFTYGRTGEEDGGAGFWRYDSASTSTANGGTILAIDGGGAGRFFRLFAGPVLLDWFCTGNGSTDDLTAFTAAAALELPLLGTPGKTYRLAGRLLVGSYFNLDLQGATLKPEYTAASGDTAGTRAAIRTADNTLGTINTVSSYTVGTNAVTLSTTPSGISVGSVIGFFGTTLGGRWPITWRTVTNIATNTLTLDEVIPYTIGGTVTCRAGNFRERFELRNGTINCTSLDDGTADVDAIIITESVKVRILSNLIFTNVSLAGASSLALDTSYCLDALTEHCIFEGAVMNGGVETCLAARSWYCHDNRYSGPGFGFAPHDCDDFWIEDCEISGTEYASPSVSVRGIRPIGCLKGNIEGNTITDIDTGIKLEDCANITVRANKLLYCGTGIAPCSDQNPSSRSGGHIIDGNIVDQFGGEGISVGGTSTGDGLWQPVILTNNRVGSTRASSTDAIVIRGGTIMAHGNVVTDWSSGSSPLQTVTADGQLTKGVLGSFVAIANTTSGRLGLEIQSTHTGLAIDYDRIVCNAPGGKFYQLPPRKFAGETVLARVSVDLNSTSDQAVTLELPDGFSRYRIASAIVTNNTSANASSAVGGIYTAASKGGTAIVDAAQTYLLLTTDTRNQVLTISTAGVQIMNDLTLFFSLSTPAGVAATGELIITAYPIT